MLSSATPTFGVQPVRAVQRMGNAAVSELEEACYRGQRMIEDTLDHADLLLDDADPTITANMKFFEDIDDKENTPIVINDICTTHPDTVWRKLGIIRQFGEFRGQPVYYNPRFRDWRYIEGNGVVPFRQISRGEESVKRRRDDVCHAVLTIIGEVSPELQLNESDMTVVDLAGSTDELAEREAIRNAQVIEKLADRMRRRNESDSESSDEDDSAEAYEAFRRILQQYLVRAIPAAAKKASGIIFTSPGGGYTAKWLGKGVKGLLESRMGHAGADEKVQVALVGVSAWPGCDVPLPLDHNFTHHLVMHRSARCRHRQCVAKDSCPGWHGAENDPNACKHCGHDRRMHIPSSVLNRHARRKLDRTEYAVEPQPDDRPLTIEVNEYISTLLDDIANGHDGDIDNKYRLERRPPHRAHVPVVCILIGGDLITTPFRLMQAVNRRWRILVIEGSGGYADVISRVFHRVQAIVPDAGQDEYRVFSTSLEPMAAEIINSGQIRIVTKGSRPEELMRMIENSLKGDEALHKAWTTCATWELNAHRMKKGYFFYNRMILFLSVFTTLLTVLQTFLLLQFAEINVPEPNPLPGAADYRGVFVQVLWTVVQWLVIALPIAISLVQGLSNRLNYGAKWVFLRTSYERLVSEIFMYRTRTRDYADEEVKKHWKHTESKDRKAEWQIYRSREELLQLRAKALMDQLLSTACNEITMAVYTGAVPPRHYQRGGDDGFCDLTPDRYVRVRVESQIVDYEARSEECGNRVTQLYLANHTFSALGTLIAAVAAYGSGSAQAWVAFTTSVVNALSRYLDYSRLEWQHQKFNSVVAGLGNVTSWWASLGPRADTKNNREQLVEHVEGLLLDEVEAWGQQLQSAMERQRKTQKDDEAEVKGMLDKVKRGEDLAQVKALKMLDCEDMTPERIADALLDPTGESAARVIRNMKQLSNSIGLGDIVTDIEDLDDVRDAAHLAQAAAVASATKAGDAISAVTQDTLGGLGVKDRVPPVLVEFVEDHDARRKFLQHLMDKTVGQLLLSDVITAASKASVAGQQLQRCSPREIVEVVKSIVIEEIMSSLLDIPLPDNSLIRIEMLVDQKADTEAFVSELFMLSRVPLAKEMNLEGIINLIQTPSTKKKFLELGQRFPKSKEMAVGSLLTSAERLFQPSTVLCQLLESALRDIAELDVEELLSQKDNRIKIWELMQRSSGLFVNFNTLSKAEVLRLFPDTIARRIQTKSQMQISRYYTRLILGTPASRVMKGFMAAYNAILPDALVRSLDLQERFAICCESLSQKDINQHPKLVLIKKMKTSTSYDSQLGKVFEQIGSLHFKPILSSLQARLAGVYTARVVDMAADQIGVIDVRALLDFEDRAMLVSKLREFKSTNIDALSKGRILQLLGFQKVVAKLDRLTEGVLRQLISRMCAVETSSWPTVTFLTVQQRCGFLDAKGHYAAILLQMDATILHRVASATQVADLYALTRLARAATPGSAGERVTGPLKMDDATFMILNQLGDDVLLQILRPMLATDLVTMLQEFKSLMGDKTLYDVIEAVSDSLDEADQEAFNNYFYHSSVLREEFAEFMVDVGQLPQPQIASLTKDAILSLLSDNTSELFEAFSKLDDNLVVQSTVHMLYELRTSVTLRLFYDLCILCPHFDIRELICDVQSRFMLFPLVAQIRHDGKLGFDEAIQIEPMSIDREAFESRGLNQHFDFDSRLAGQESWGSRFVDTCEDLGDDYHGITEDLRSFMEPQLRYAMVQADQLLRNSVLGKFYMMDFQANLVNDGLYFGLPTPMPLSLSDKCMLDQMIKDLQNEIVHEPARLMSLMDRFNAEKFLLKSATDRSNTLSQAVPNSPERAKVIVARHFPGAILQAYFDRVTMVMNGSAQRRATRERRWTDVFATVVVTAELKNARHRAMEALMSRGKSITKQ
eukprot:PhM_4_TR3646/c0_g2_i1/m.59598